MRIKRSSNRALWIGRHGSTNERSQNTRTAKNGFNSSLGSARIQQFFVKVSDTTQRDAEDLFQLPHLLLLLMVMLKTTWFPVNSEHPRHMSLIKGGSILAFFVIVSISPILLPKPQPPILVFSFSSFCHPPPSHHK